MASRANSRAIRSPRFLLVIAASLILYLWAVIFEPAPPTFNRQVSSTKLHATLSIAATAPPPLPPLPPAEAGGRRKGSRRRRGEHNDAAGAATAGATSLSTESPTEALARARSRVAVPDAWRRQRDASFAAYVKLHRAFSKADGDAPSPTDAHVPGRGALPRRFIVVKPCCQLCNRVRVLVSALALGILTDRAVLMDFDGSEGDAKSTYYGKFADLFESPLDIEAPLPREVSSSTAKGARSVQWITMMADVLCMEPLAWTEPVVTLHGSPAFLHILFLHPKLKVAFTEHFGSGLDGLFRDIFHALIPPKRSIYDKANAFYAQLASDFFVGLHIRNGRDFRTKKLLGDEWKQLAACATALAPSHGGRGSGNRFVVATESAESREAAGSALGDGAAFYEQALPKGSSSGGSASREGAQRALLELLIVSMSNATVLTPMSSFSEVAAALSGKPGLYFHFDLARKFHYESATEAAPGCFVPWTAEMPGSMNLQALLKALPETCRAGVHEANRGSPWVAPTGLRFLDGRPPRLPSQLAKKVTPY